MNQDDIFDKTKEAYLILIHPALESEADRARIAGLVALALSVPDETAAVLIVGNSWRERLLGFFFAMSKEPANFVKLMVESLRDLRGLAIVPTSLCAKWMKYEPIDEGV